MCIYIYTYIYYCIYTVILVNGSASETFEFLFSRKRSIHLTRYQRGVSCKEEKDKWCPARALEKYRQAGNGHGSS